MGYYRKMPENVEGLQIAGKKFYKAAEGAALYSMGIHTFERIAKDAKAKYKIGKSALYNVEKIDEYFKGILKRIKSRFYGIPFVEKLINEGEAQDEFRFAFYALCGADFVLRFSQKSKKNDKDFYNFGDSCYSVFYILTNFLLIFYEWYVFLKIVLRIR